MAIDQSHLGPGPGIKGLLGRLVSHPALVSLQ